MHLLASHIALTQAIILDTYAWRYSGKDTNIYHSGLISH
jgi:hypothetical protein